MSDKPIEIEFDNKEVHEKLLNLAKKDRKPAPFNEKYCRYFCLFNRREF